MVNKGFKNNFRKTKTGRIIFGKEIDGRESQTKKELYKKAINKCCIPNCIYGYDLETHHIKPLGKGGSDIFNNYIILCNVCHRKLKYKLHSQWRMNLVQMFIFKFYTEQSVLGLNVTSDNYSDEEFQKLLRNYVYKYNHPTRTLKEEQKSEGINP